MNRDTKSSIFRRKIFVLFRWNSSHRNCPQYWPTTNFAAIIFWGTAVTNCVESTPWAAGTVGTSFASLLFTSCGRFITVTAEAVLTGAVVIEDVIVEPSVAGTVVAITARINLHSTVLSVGFTSGMPRRLSSPCSMPTAASRDWRFYTFCRRPTIPGHRWTTTVFIIAVIHQGGVYNG